MPSFRSCSSISDWASILGVVHHLLDGFERLLAMLHDELHELIEPEELVLAWEIPRHRIRRRNTALTRNYSGGPGK